MNEQRWLSWASIVAMTVAMAGCVNQDAGNDPPKGQIGGVQDDEGCKVVETQVLALNDITSLGFSAAQVLSTVGGMHTTPLTWAKGAATTTATVTVGTPTAMRFIKRTWADEGNGSGIQSDIAADCSDRVEIDAPLGFSTADGAFAETFPVTLAASDASAADFFHEIDVSKLQGSYHITEVNPAEFKAVHVYLQGSFAGSALTGTVSGMAESFPAGTGPTAVVSASAFDVAKF